MIYHRCASAKGSGRGTVCQCQGSGVILFPDPHKMDSRRGARSTALRLKVTYPQFRGMRMDRLEMLARHFKANWIKDMPIWVLRIYNDEHSSWASIKRLINYMSMIFKVPQFAMIDVVNSMWGY